MVETLLGNDIALPTALYSAILPLLLAPVPSHSATLAHRLPPTFATELSCRHCSATTIGGVHHSRYAVKQKTLYGHCGSCCRSTQRSENAQQVAANRVERFESARKRRRVAKTIARVSPPSMPAPRDLPARGEATALTRLDSAPPSRLDPQLASAPLATTASVQPSPAAKRKRQKKPTSGLAELLKAKKEENKASSPLGLQDFLHGL